MSATTGFPDSPQDDLLARMQSHGARGVVAFIQGFDDGERRRELYSFAQRLFGQGDWTGKNCDAYIQVAEAGIAEGLRQSTASADEEAARQCKDFANRVSYNLAADLAECWPHDPIARERRHFERGLQAAQDCLRWRTELNKPPFPFAIAWWARGMHELSLGKVDESVASFEHAYDYGVKSVPAGEPDTVRPGGAFIVILNAGYLGIARAVAGDHAGGILYEEACAAFAGTVAQATDPEQKEDAEFGLAQLRCVHTKFVKS